MPQTVGSQRRPAARVVAGGALALALLALALSPAQTAGLQAAAQSIWLSLCPPPLVVFTGDQAAVRITVRMPVQTAQVTVSPDGRELWWELAGGETTRDEDLQTSDPQLARCDVLPVGQARFVVRLQLRGYVGHDTEHAAGEATLLLIRSPVIGRRVVLDPGHGGRDPGAVAATGEREADLTLAVATELARLMGMAGAEVRLTRDENTDFSLYSYRTMDSAERAAVANQWPADVYVSIHFNMYKSPQYGGTEVWHRGDNPLSENLAKLMVSELAGLGLNRRGTRTGDYAVLREATMPAVLVELGFLSHPADLAFFVQAANRDHAAWLMRDALLAFARANPE